MRFARARALAMLAFTLGLVGCSDEDEVYIPDEVPPLQELQISGDRDGTAADGQSAAGENRDGGFERQREVRPIDP